MAAGFRRAFRLRTRPRADAATAVDDELSHHLDLVVEELVEEGWAPDEARREAERRFGDVEGARAYCMEIQTRRGRVDERTRILDETWQDLKHALRGMVKSPGYAGLVVATLAFGIAANTSIFSLMNPYFFRPLPFGEAEELVQVGQVDPVSGWDMARLSLPMAEDWEARSRGLEAAAAYTYTGMNLTGPEGAEGINVSRVSWDMLDVLGVRPALGRGFTASDGGPGAAPVVLLDHGFWERRYLGDRSVVGRAVTLDGEAHTVIGIMPPEFVFPFNRVVAWTPVRESAAEADRGGATPYLLVGRLAAGWDRVRLDAELTAVQAELSAEHPDADGRWAGVTVQPLRQALNFGWDILTVSFGILLGAVFFVLALACVNVASLTLARAGTRRRELAVRAALGASRGRVVRQLLTESALLAVGGGVVGVVMAWWVVGMVGPLLPPDIFRVGEASLDRTVLLFTLGVTALTPLLFGLAPALATSRRALAGGLWDREGGAGGRGAARGRKLLVGAQVALAMVLLTGAGLMVRSFAAVRALDLGFEPDRVAYASVTPPEADYTLEEARAFTRDAVARLAALPGVTSASASLFLPLNHETSVRRFAALEGAGAPADDWPTAVLNRTWPGYFQTMGIPLRAGRDFRESDGPDEAPVVVVNEALAERVWPGGEAVGRTLLVGEPGSAREVTVVGMVGAVHHREISRTPPGPQLYQPVLQAGNRRQFLLLRTEGDPAGLVAAARRTLSEIDPDLPFSVHPYRSVVRENEVQWSLGSSFLGAFGLGALLLATLGIYGLVSFSVSQRRREMGVRLALGASRSGIRSAVVRDALALTAAGLGVGLLLSVALGRVMAAALFGVPALDPVTFSAIPLLFMAVAAAASFVPAWRASGTDPVTALRAE